MGGDGGVCAVNRTYMRQCGEGFMKEGGGGGVSAREAQMEKTRTCAMSQEPLREPIVCCELGFLYNKTAILTALLDRSVNEAFSHVRGLKDLIEPKFTRNPAASEEGGAKLPSVPPYICPVTGAELNGAQPFCVIRTTGWVLAERALKEVGLDGLQAEYGPFEEDDIIRLAPTQEERQELRSRMEVRRAKAKAAKKALKRSSSEKNGEGFEHAAVRSKELQIQETEKRHKKRKTKMKTEEQPKLVPVVGSSSVLEAANEAVKRQMNASQVYKQMFAKR